MTRRWRKGSEFGRGERRPMDREQRSQFRAKLRLGRRPNRIPLGALRLGEIMVNMLGVDGRLDPSLDALARRAGVNKDTVVASLDRLERFGFLRRTRRLIRVGGRVEQTTNSYVLLVPGSESDFPAGVSTRIQRTAKQMPTSIALEDRTARENAARQLKLLGFPHPWTAAKPAVR